jgi:hypothetical protein
MKCESNVSKAVGHFCRCGSGDAAVLLPKAFVAMSSPSKKQVVADCSNPLLHAGLLELILELVGPGQTLLSHSLR